MTETIEGVSTSADAVAPSLTSRGSATRQALLDSTIALLAATGFAATTTQAVLNHSGLSRGSLLHQFKTRNHLMVAAALEAVERMFDGVSDGLAKSPSPISALRRYPDVLWQVQNEAPARAFAELQLASRWEQDLQSALRPAVTMINERIAREIREFAEVCGLHSVDELVIEVGVLITAMQGLAISGSLSEQPPDEILATLKAHYLSCVERLLRADP